VALVIRPHSASLSTSSVTKMRSPAFHGALEAGVVVASVLSPVGSASRGTSASRPLSWLLYGGAVVEKSWKAGSCPCGRSRIGSANGTP